MGLSDSQFNDRNTLSFFVFLGFLEFSLARFQVSILRKMPDCPRDYQLLHFDYFNPM